MTTQRSGTADDWIDPPEPGVTADEMLRRAVALCPRLRAAQEECERLGQVPSHIVQELVAAGFFRLVQPRRFGGYEFDVPAFYRIMMELARGCSETGWVVSLVGGHPIVVAHYAEQTQIEVYGKNGDFRCPGALTPPGRAIPVAGGYRITHSWVSASGIDLGTHFMGLAMVDGASEPTPVQLLIDIDKCTVVDDWAVMGMRGTGSKRVEVKEVFVPSHRSLPVQGMNRGAEPFAHDVHLFENPMYSGRIGPFLVGETAAVAVGAARGALDVYEELLRVKRSNVPPYRTKCHDPVSQHHYGTALSLVATAEAALIRCGEEHMQFAADARSGKAPFDDAQARRLTMIAQRCTQLAWDAIELIYRTAGTSASAKLGAPIGRFMRNVAVLRTHPVLQHDYTAIAAALTDFDLAVS